MKRDHTWKARKAQGIKVLWVAVAIGATASCGLNSSKSEYVMAEKLWTEGRYKAAVLEFEKVYNRDPKGKLGRQALFRAAMTRAYFLSPISRSDSRLRALC